jgi:hypothetical protein
MPGTGQDARPGKPKEPVKGPRATAAAVTLIVAVLLMPSAHFLLGMVDSTSGLNKGKNGASSTNGKNVQTGPFDFRASGNMSLRFYNSTSPANGKLFGLQKGAVLVDGPNETIGEGAGFGAPVLNWSGRTYFSKTARTETIAGGISKTFVLDSIEVGQTYNTSFVPVEPAGEVEVRFRVNGPVLSIEANISRIPRNATLLMLNEQAGSIYYRYTDHESSVMVVDFSWKNLTGGYNSIFDSRGFGFGVDYTPGLYHGTTLYLGRETAPEGFDWAGLDYSLDLSEFNGSMFAYDVYLVGG